MKAKVALIGSAAAVAAGVGAAALVAAAARNAARVEIDHDDSPARPEADPYLLRLFERQAVEGDDPS